MTDETKTTTPEGAYPSDLPVVPLREAVVFPKLVVPLGVGREKSVAAINAAMAEERHLIVLVAQRDAEIDDVQPEQIYNVGTVAEIVRLLRIPDGSAQIIVQGAQRVKITGYQPESRFFRVTFEPIVEELGDPVEREAQLRNVKALFERYVDNGGSILPELAMTAKNTDDPAHFSDLVASSPDLTLEQRQQLLETKNVIERLRFLSVFLAKQNEILELKQKIQSEVQQTLDKTQREYILREQMKAIQKELGDDDQGSEVRELREKIEAAGMPDPREGEGAQGARPSREDPAGVAGDGRHPHLRGLARVAALEGLGERRLGHLGGGEDPRRGSLRPAEGEGPDHRVHGGAQALAEPARADPVLRRPARRGQDQPRQVDRARDGPQVHPHVARRHP